MHWKWGKYFAFLVSGTILIAFTFNLILGAPPITVPAEESENLSNGPWPSFGRDMSNTRFSPFNTSHVDGTLKWSYESDTWLWSSPAIGSEDLLYFGSPNNNMYALNTEDGSEQWIYSSGGHILSSPAVSQDETIYFGSGDYNIYALNPDGSLKWTYATEGEIYSSPNVDEDGNVYVGSYDGNLYSVDKDGTLNWKFSSDSWLWSSPAIGSENVVYVGSGDEKLYAIDGEDGTEIWNFPTGGDIYSSPAVADDGTIYFGSYDGFLYALNPDGSLKWSYNIGAKIHPSPGIGEDGTVYVGSHNGGLYAIKDGTLQWYFETDDRISSSAAISADGLIYFGSEDGKLYAVDLDGNEKWSYETGSSIYASPAIGEKGNVFVSSYDGSMYAFTGTQDKSEVSMSITIAGRKYNSVEAIIEKNGDVIGTTVVVRTPGEPNEAVIDFNYSNEHNYTLILKYVGTYLGANPVNMTFTSGFGHVRIFKNFVSAHGGYQEVEYDLNEEIGEMISKTREFRYFAEGGTALKPLLSVLLIYPGDEPIDFYFYDNNDGSLIGSATNIPSGEIAQVYWDGLKPDTNYQWHANASTGEEVLELGPWEFSTVRIDDIKITDSIDGTPLEGGYVKPNSQITGFLSGYNDTYGFVGALVGNWHVSGGDAELTYDGFYRKFSGVNVGDTPGDVWFNATYMDYTYSVKYIVSVPVSEIISQVPREITIEGMKGLLDLGEYIPDIDEKNLHIFVDDPNVKVIGHNLLFDYEEPGTYEVTVEVGDEISSTSFDISVEVNSVASEGSIAGETSSSIGPLWLLLLLLPVGIAGGLLHVKKNKYTLEDMFLIHSSGLLIRHTSKTLKKYRSEDILAGMFLAVNNFVEDAFGGEDKDTLQRMEYGDNIVLVQKGEHVILAVFLSGEVSSKLYESMSNLVADIEERYQGDIEEWNGDLRELSGVTDMLEYMHEKQGKYNRGDWQN